MLPNELKSNIDFRGKNVFVGLSGGVDSSVSAYLLKQMGADVTGVFIKVWQPDFVECTWREDRQDALRVAASLDIPFVTLDLVSEYKTGVIDYMIREYENGRTPNPDIMCNQQVKFGAFYDWAMNNGADFIATGHYARSDYNGNLIDAIDNSKDQTYFLYRVKEDSLKKSHFPIGSLLKSEVRKIAEQASLITAGKKDSQGLCFVGKIDMKTLLSEYITPKSGEVLDVSGDIIGSHSGATFLTNGERHGFTLNNSIDRSKPYFVVDKNIKTNTITVSTNRNENSQRLITIDNCVWRRSLTLGEELLVQTRYRGEKHPATIKSFDGDACEISLQSDTTFSSGQSAVIYVDNICIGGGIIK